jgi:leader peptidase (prepilin peptidase)/N-methyltransferase
MRAADIADRSLVLSTLALAGFYATLVPPTLWRQEPPVAWLLASAALALALPALSAVDLRDYRLPDVLTLPLAAAGVLPSWWLGLASPWRAIGSAVIGFALLTGVAMLYSRVRGRDGLGLGDAKLFGASGAWLGLEGLPAVLLVACGAGHRGAVGRHPHPVRAVPGVRHLDGLALWCVVSRCCGLVPRPITIGRALLGMDDDGCCSSGLRVRADGRRTCAADGPVRAAAAARQR